MLIFKWGKKRGRGGMNKDVQFYESFNFDGVDYSLYDCVYMNKEGELAPYIGKLIKIWETGQGVKKVKVQWFFRSWEILNYLEDATVLENELFFASGDGIGVADLNLLEAVAGKCNVICISTDPRNPQPSAEELQMADYVFYRIFDVESYTISDQMDDKVGGLEVDFVYNRRKCISTLGSPKLVSAEKNEGNVVESSSSKKKDGCKDLKSRLNLAQAEGMKNHGGESCALDDAPSNRGKFVGSITSESNGVQGSSVLVNDALQNLTCATMVGCRKDEKPCENSNVLYEKLKISLSEDAPIFGLDDDDVEHNKNSQLNENLNASHGHASKTKEKLNFGHDKSQGDKEASGPASNPIQNLPTLNIKDDDGKAQGKVGEVTSKPLTGVEFIRSAEDEGRLVLLHNLDPQCTHGEVERIIWHKFQEDCTARMLSNAHPGRAYVVFKSVDAATRVIQELHEEQSKSPNQRCLMAGLICATPPRNIGHYAQKNAIGYRMALDWCLLQLQSDKWWGSLHEQQQTELKKLMENLRSKFTLGNPRG